jgi:hypothetical protein
MNPNPLRFLGDGLPIVDKNGVLLPAVREWFRGLELRVAPVLTGLPSPGGLPAGQIHPTAKVAGRTEGIGTTVGKLDTTGKLTPPGVGFTVDGVPDGVAFVRTTPNEKTGGGRGFNALDVNNRLQNSFRGNALNASSAPTSSSVLSNDGISTAITIAASTGQFGPGSVSYNSGSVDPGGFGTFFVFADDPTFAGGSVIYQFSASAPDQTASDGRVNFGKITTAGGTPHTGGGFSGGDTPGGGGGRGYNFQ